MTVRPAWPVDANAASETMRSRPDLKIAAFLDSITDEELGITSVADWEILGGFSPSRAGGDRRATGGAVD